MLTDEIIAEIWRLFSEKKRNTEEIRVALCIKEESTVARVVAACMERQYREAHSRKEAV